MWQVHLTDSARRDISFISEYTEKKWGVSQKKIINRQLKAAISFIREFPYCGKTTEIEGVFAHVVPRIPFIIVYKKDATAVIVFNVVHTSRKS